MRIAISRFSEEKKLHFFPGTCTCNLERDSRQDGTGEKGEGRK